MTAGLMGLSADEFWSDLERSRDEAAAHAAEGTWRGYAIDAPAVVDVSVRDSLPVVGVRCLSAVDSARHDFQSNGVVVAVRVESNEVFVARAFEWKYRPPTRTPKRPPPLTVIITDTFELDLRARLPAMPWATGTLHVHLLVLDAAAEHVDVALVGPHAPPAALARRAPRPSHDDDRASYTRTAQTPAVPVAPGISMVTERVVLLEDGARCTLTGSFRLPVCAPDVVSWSANDEETTRRQAVLSPSMREVDAAYVPMTLVITGAGLTEPWRFDAVLPTRDAPFADGDLVAGCFSLDLLALDGAPRAPGTYHLWAFSGPVAAGPETFALVAAERLAPP
jgi:hypothetical protein